MYYLQKTTIGVKKRFVNEEILLGKLPVFVHTDVTEEQLDKLCDLIEEELILKKAKEIEEKRAKK